jgi:hypothetical protein
MEYYILSIAVYRAVGWALRKIGQKYLERFTMWGWRRTVEIMWAWRRTEEIIWTDRVRNEEVLQRVKEEKNILFKRKRNKVNWIAHILRRNCRLKHVIEGKVETIIQVT